MPALSHQPVSTATSAAVQAAIFSVVGSSQAQDLLLPDTTNQMLLAGDIRALPYYGPLCGIQFDEPERVMVWSELEMTATFYLFRMERAWALLQALSRGVTGALAAQWRPEQLAYPAVTVVMMGWKSACGLLLYFYGRFVFCPPPVGAGLPQGSEIRKGGAIPHSSGPPNP